MIREALGRLLVMVHPDHREQRRERQRNQQSREPIIHELDFRHEKNDCGGDEELHQIKRSETENFIPRNAVHELAVEERLMLP